MNKVLLIQTLCEKIEADLEALKMAALAAHAAATDPENKAENAYDTRGLEASYLAEAQAKRVAELEETLFYCRALNATGSSPGETVRAGSLVELHLGNKQFWVLLVVKGAGISITWEGKTIQTITPTSPLGEALVGSKAGETCELEQGKELKEYRIRTVV